jgi:hypothetical protein
MVLATAEQNRDPFKCFRVGSRQVRIGDNQCKGDGHQPQHAECRHRPIWIKSAEQDRPVLNANEIHLQQLERVPDDDRENEEKDQVWHRFDDGQPHSLEWVKHQPQESRRERFGPGKQAENELAVDEKQYEDERRL